MSLSPAAGVNNRVKIVSGTYTDTISMSRFRAIIGVEFQNRSLGNEIHLPDDMCKSAFDSFVQYCRDCPQKITLENAYDMRRAAKQWNMMTLQEEVALFMEKRANDFVVLRLLDEIEEYGEEHSDEIERLESQLSETIAFQVNNPVFLAHAKKLGLPRLLRIFKGKREKIKDEAAQFLSNCLRDFGDDALELLGTEGEVEAYETLLAARNSRPERIQPYRFWRYVPLSLPGLLLGLLILGLLNLVLVVIILADQFFGHAWLRRKFEQMFGGSAPEPDL